MADEGRAVSPQQMRKPKLGYAILPHQDAPDVRANTSAARWSVVASDGALLGNIFGKLGAGSGYIASTTLAAGGSAALVTVGPASLLQRQLTPSSDGLPPLLTWSQVLTEIVALLEREGWVCLSSADQLRDIERLDVEDEARPAAGLTKRERPVYSEERMRQALQDIGWNTSCNACMGLFYADDGPFVHSDGCPFELDGTTVTSRPGPAAAGRPPAPTEVEAKPAAEPADQGAPLYSEEHLRQGLSNIGWNTSCGACMGLFHTGYSMHPHTDGCPRAPGVAAVTLDPGTAGASRPPTLAEATSIITAWLPEASKIWSWYTGADKDVVAVTVFLPGLSAPAHWTSDQPHAVSPILLDGSDMGPGLERDAWADAWGRLYRGRANAPKHVWRWAPWTVKVDTGA